jgi:small subunit ribosomal protein S14
MAQRLAKIKKQQKQEKKQKFPTRKHSRCARCGRARGYIGKFGVCRHCVKELALKGVIPGLKKAS